MSSVHQLAIAIRLLLDETYCQQKEKRETRVRNEKFGFAVVCSTDLILNAESYVEDNTGVPYISNSDDNLPYKYRHMRSSIKDVRPEIYVVMEKLAASYHMSHRQIQGAITTIANDLFGHKQFGEWKMFAEQGNESPFDNNTLPSPSSSWPTER